MSAELSPEQKTLHFLSRTSFGPTQEEVLRVNRLGIRAYLDEQLEPEKISDNVAEVMVDFWNNHFNIFAGKGADRWLTTAYERDTIRPHALGRFRDLLLATAQSPAMLFYLDNWLRISPQNPAAQRPPNNRRRGINENYAREVMELHTLGVDGGYTQRDVQEVARCFTGWTIFDPRGYRNAALGEKDDRAGQFYFNPRLHDDGEKIVLGHKIP